MDEMKHFLVFLCFLYVSHGLTIPRDMWEPGLFPAGVPKLDSKQAFKVLTVDQETKPVSLRDRSYRKGGLDMDDEFEIPLMVHLSVLSSEDPDQDQDLSIDESNKEEKSNDWIIRQVDWEPKKSRLLSGLYGYGYGASYSTVAVPVVQATKTYVPVVPVVPVVQQPVVQVPQTVAVAVQPLAQTQQTVGLTQQQQTTVLGTQRPTIATPDVTQQTGQGRMALPQTPAVQPQVPAVQPQVPAVQPQLPVAQPDLTGQGRSGLPDVGAANTQQPTVQTAQTQTMLQPTITVKHQVTPQHIHIIIPKSKKVKHRNYYY